MNVTLAVNSRAPLCLEKKKRHFWLCTTMLGWWRALYTPSRATGLGTTSDQLDNELAVC